MVSQMKHVRLDGQEQQVLQAEALQDRWISTENQARGRIVAGEDQLAEEFAETAVLPAKTEAL